MYFLEAHIDKLLFINSNQSDACFSESPLRTTAIVLISADLWNIWHTELRFLWKHYCPLNTTFSCVFLIIPEQMKEKNAGVFLITFNLQLFYCI